METIDTLNTYDTDIFNSWGIGQTTKPITYSFENVLKYANNIKAKVIVKTSTGKFWYIKGINNHKSYQEIKCHLENNLKSGYKPNKQNLVN